MSSAQGNGDGRSARDRGREDVLGLADEARIEPVTVTLRSGQEKTFHVRTYSALQHGQLEMRLRVRKGKEWDVDSTLYKAQVLAACLCTAEGQLLFDQGEFDKIARLPNVALGKLFDKACEVNGLGAAAVEEAEKNSETTPSASSSSG